MLKRNKTILLLLLLIILCSFLKPILWSLFSNLDAYYLKLIEEALQAFAVISFISITKLWNNMGNLFTINKKSITLLLPIIVLSFVSLFNGLVTYNFIDLMIVLVICLLIGITEELACRGVLLSELRKKGHITSIILSSLIFASLHIMNLFKGADFESTLIQIIFAFGFGLTMAIVRSKTNLLLPQILVHALWDFNSKISNNHSTSGSLDLLIYLSLIVVVLWGFYLLWKEQKAMRNS